MKNARADYDVIQDCTAARQLAELVLDMSFVGEKGQNARKLARLVLGLEEVLTPDTVLITTNGTTRLIPKDEPVFLIRGQDKVGGETVRYWASLAAQAGADAKILRVARTHAGLMDAWPKKKTPDLPE